MQPYTSERFSPLYWRVEEFWEGNVGNLKKSLEPLLLSDFQSLSLLLKPLLQMWIRRHFCFLTQHAPFCSVSQHSSVCLHYFNLTIWHWDFLQASIVCGLLCWAEMCRVMCGCVGRKYTVSGSKYIHWYTWWSERWSAGELNKDGIGSSYKHVFLFFNLGTWVLHMKAIQCREAWDGFCDLSMPSSGEQTRSTVVRSQLENHFL